MVEADAKNAVTQLVHQIPKKVVKHGGNSFLVCMQTSEAAEKLLMMHGKIIAGTNCVLKIRRVEQHLGVEEIFKYVKGKLNVQEKTEKLQGVQHVYNRKFRNVGRQEEQDREEEEDKRQKKTPPSSPKASGHHSKKGEKLGNVPSTNHHPHPSSAQESQGPQPFPQPQAPSGGRGGYGQGKGNTPQYFGRGKGGKGWGGWNQFAGKGQGGTGRGFSTGKGQYGFQSQFHQAASSKGGGKGVPVKGGKGAHQNLPNPSGPVKEPLVLA